MIVNYEELSNTEKLRLLLKQRLNRDDICLLMPCSKATASRHITKIGEDMGKRGIMPRRGNVSVSEFLSYAGWNLNEIIEKAKLEKIMGFVVENH